MPNYCNFKFVQINLSAKIPYIFLHAPSESLNEYPPVSFSRPVRVWAVGCMTGGIWSNECDISLSFLATLMCFHGVILPLGNIPSTLCHFLEACFIVIPGHRVRFKQLTAFIVTEPLTLTTLPRPSVCHSLFATLPPTCLMS